VYRVTGGGPANDSVSDVSGVNQGWVVHGADVIDGVMYHRVNNELIDTFQHAYNTQFEGRFVIGANWNLDTFTEMDVVAAFHYDVALTEQERSDLHAYIEDRYQLSTAVIPVADNDFFEIETGNVRVFDVLANDSDDLSLDPSSLTVVEQPTSGTLQVNSDGTVTYAHSGVAESDSFSYTIADIGGNVSNLAAVQIEIDFDLSPIAIDDTVSVAFGGSAQADVLANDTDDFGLETSTLTIIQTPENGSATVDASTGIISYVHEGTGGSDSLTYVVLDTTGQRSEPATLNIEFSTPGDIPISGLVAHYESGRGVTTSGGVITAWQDLSGLGNNLASVGNPTLLDGIFEDEPVIAFDGELDRLERLTEITGLPASDNDRTVFMLARYQDTGVGGFAYGTPAANQVFGLAVNRFGRLGVQGFGAGNDFFTTTNGEALGWAVHTVVVDDGVVAQEVDGNQISVELHDFDTDPQRIVLGAEISGSPQLSMQVAAILVYDRVVSFEEATRIQEYLSIKYDTNYANAEPPVAVADRARVPSGATIDIAVLDNDESYGIFATSTLEIVEAPISGTVSVDSSTGVVEYVHGGFSTSDSFSYRVANDLGKVSNVANVVVTIGEPINLPTDGLVAHYEADSLATLDATGSVSVLGDLSGRNNDLTGVGDVAIVDSVLNGRPVLDFDGGDDQVGDALVREGGLSGLPTGAQPRTLYQVVRYESEGSGGFGYGQRRSNQTFGLHVQGPNGLLRVNGFGGGNDFVSDTLGTGSGWIVQSVVYDGSEFVHRVGGVEIDSGSHTFNTASGPIVVGADLDQDPYVDMQVAAVLMYDRALSADELANVDAYLEDGFGVSSVGAPIAVSDLATIRIGGAAEIDLLRNDEVVDGFIDAASVEIVEPPQLGTVVVNPSTGVATYQHTQEIEGQDAFSYRVANDAGRYSVEARVTVDLLSDFPPTAVDDEFFFVADGSVSVDVSVNDTDDSGVNPESVVIVSLPQGGSASVTTEGLITYEHDGVSVSDSLSYTIADDAGIVSNAATVTFVLPGALPTDGLVIHLESDFGVVQNSGVVSSWLDQSGNGNDLETAGDPRLEPGDLAVPVVSFDGSTDRLERSSGLAGLPSGANDRSVFMLVNYEQAFGGAGGGTIF